MLIIIVNVNLILLLKNVSLTICFALNPNEFISLLRVIDILEVFFNHFFTFIFYMGILLYFCLFFKCLGFVYFRGGVWWVFFCGWLNGIGGSLLSFIRPFLLR